MKSPKELLAETIAYELSDYLIIDPRLVKSNLLEHSKIILRKVSIKPRTVELSSSTTKATITGIIDLLLFEWSWSVLHGDGWIKDCILKILGLHVHVQLDKLAEDSDDDGAAAVVRTDDDDDDDNDVSDKEEENALDVSYVDRQIQNVIDSLTLHIRTYQVTLEMPLNFQDDSTTTNNSDGDDTISIIFEGSSVDIACCSKESSSSSQEQYKREVHTSADNDDTAARTSPATTSIGQEFSMSSLSAHVHVKSSSHSGEPLSYPLLEPFGYHAQVTRYGGLRFESLTTGLIVSGDASTTSPTDKGEDIVVLHAGVVQMHALSQLVDLVNGTDDSAGTKNEPENRIGKPKKGMSEVDAMSAESSTNGGTPGADKPAIHGSDTNVTTNHGIPNDALETVSSEKPEIKRHITGANITNSSTDEQTTCSSSSDDEKQNNVVSGSSTPDDYSNSSSFDIPITSFSVVFMEKMTLTISGLHVKYKSDGTLLTVHAQRFDVESNALSEKERGLQAGVAGIQFQLLPNMKLTIDSIEKAHVPGVLDLTKELKFPSIEYVGDTAYIDIASAMEATILNEADPEETTEEKAVASAKSSATSHKQEAESEGGIVPFPIRVSFKEIKLTKESDKSLSTMTDFVIGFHPQNSAEFVGTAIATHLGEFESDLLHCQNANASVIVSKDTPRVMHSLSLDADSIRVQSGYTMEDWIEQFEPSRLRQIVQAKEGPLQTPFARIAALKIQVGFKGTGVSVDDTTVHVKAFRGKADCTSKDIVEFYAKACARRVSGFISNAKIEGHNLVETTAVYGTVAAGLEDLGGPSAVVALAGVDSAKDLLARGKESRHATSDDNYKEGDFTRGVLATPGHFAKIGAKVRGKQDSDHEDVTDLAVGAVSSVGTYTVDNKARLGGAFFAGIGVLGGAAIAGPIGAILGGIIAGEVATRALKRFDSSSIGKKFNKRIKEDLAGIRFQELAAKHHASKSDKDHSSALVENDNDNHASKSEKHTHSHGLMRHRGHREKRHHEKFRHED